MIILAVDTSLGPCSVALWRGDSVIAERVEHASGQQSRRLIPMMQEVLASANADYSDCDAVACTIGPGGFTGIRTGLTAARAIALVTGKPLIGLTTLEAIAWGAQMKGDILAVIDAYREQWYVQRFRRMEILASQSDPLLVDEKGMKALAHGAKTVTAIPTAAHVAALAHDKWRRGERQFSSSPLYIREPDAKLPV